MCSHSSCNAVQIPRLFWYYCQIYIHVRKVLTYSLTPHNQAPSFEDFIADNSPVHMQHSNPSSTGSPLRTGSSVFSIWQDGSPATQPSSFGEADTSTPGQTEYLHYLNHSPVTDTHSKFHPPTQHNRTPHPTKAPLRLSTDSRRSVQQRNPRLLLRRGTPQSRREPPAPTNHAWRFPCRRDFSATSTATGGECRVGAASCAVFVWYSGG